MLSLALSAVIQATMPALLEPVSPWVVDGSGPGCIATRQYDVSAGVSVGFEHRMARRDPVLVIAAGAHLLPVGSGKTPFGIGAPEQAVAVEYTATPSRTGPRTLVRLYPEADVLPRIVEARSWHVGKIGVRLDRGAAVLKALDKCVTDLLVSWSVDPKVFFDSRMARVIPEESQRYLGYRSYPSEALKQGIAGRVTMVLTTAPDGKATKCKVVESDHDSLGARTCESARRMRFEPPRDEKGQAIASYVIVPVTWVLPH